MDTLSYKTQSLNKSNVSKEWVVVDAEDMVLGRLCTEIAMLIRGKRKPGYTPHTDCGDNVIVINSDKVKLTGNKWDKKEYISHTGYPGGQRMILAKDLKAKNSIFLIEKAVKGMLPGNRLGRALFKNLYVYQGAEHPHQAQNPKEIQL